MKCPKCGKGNLIWSDSPSGLFCSKCLRIFNEDYIEKPLIKDDVLIEEAESIAFKTEALELGIEHYDEAERLHNEQLSGTYEREFDREIALQNAWSLARIATHLESIDAVLGCLASGDND